jgi:hypothetical protein
MRSSIARRSHDALIVDKAINGIGSAAHFTIGRKSCAGQNRPAQTKAFLLSDFRISRTAAPAQSPTIKQDENQGEKSWLMELHP